MVLGRGISKVLFATTLLIPLPSYAETGTGSNAIPSAQMAPQGSAGQAGNAMGQQMLGAGMNAATGAKMAAMCAVPTQQWACPMAAMSFVQAAMMMMSSSKSGDTMDYSMGGFDYDPKAFMSEVPGFEEYGVGTTPEDLEAFISKGTEKLKNSGWDYDPATGVMTKPDGSTFVVDENTGASAGALAGAAGGSAADMKLADSTALGLAEKIGNAFAGKGLNKASVSGMGFESNGGGSASSSGGGSGDSLSNYFSSLNRKPTSLEKNRMIAGKSRLLGNDSIGISVDNIFEMVHRRYQAQRKANNFLEPIINKNVRKK